MMNTWVMKSVKPSKPGWYMVWREDEPDLIQPHYWDGKRWNYPDFDMWCHQPAVPDAESFHNRRAMINAKKN